MDTAAIVTTNANRTLSAIHARMPVILPPDAFDLWLDCAHVDAPTAAALLVPPRDDRLEAYEISPAVNRVANDFEALIMPLSQGVPGQEAPIAETPAKRRKAATEPDGQASLF